MKAPTVRKSDKLFALQRVLLALVAVLVVAVGLLAGLSRNTIVQSRGEGDYTAVEAVAVTHQEGQTQCRFTLDHIAHAETLAFFISHHNIAVDIGGERVYSMRAQHRAFDTCGGDVGDAAPLRQRRRKGGPHHAGTALR